MMVRFLFYIVMALTISTPAVASRERQALEAYELQQLTFVEFYADDAPNTSGTCKPTAWVKDPGGYIHRVLIGDYVGRNYGRVVEITANGVRLLEAVQRADGEWIHREAWLKRGKSR